MIKKVNVRTYTEIRNIETPIYNSKQNISMNTKDIRTCLMKGAYVYEILRDGSTIRLNLNNYNKENDVIASPVMNYDETPIISNTDNKELPVAGKDVITKEVEPAVEEAPVAETVDEAQVEEVEPAIEEAPVEEAPVAETVEEAPVAETVEEVEPAVEEAPVAETTKTTTTTKKKRK